MVNVAIDTGYELAVRAMIHLEPGMLVGVDAEGRIPLVHAAQVILNSGIDGYQSLDGISMVLLDNTNIDIEAMKKMVMTRIAVSMHDLVTKDYKSTLQLLPLIESHDTEGWSPLASAAFNNKEALCEFLVGNGCGLCLDMEQKEQLKPKLSCSIHLAAKGGHKTALQLLLDMGVDINKRNSDGVTALLEAIYYNHLSCVKILIERGADVTILTNYGNSVLHRAVWRSTEGEMMKFLLDVVETRELVDIKNASGVTALHDCGFWDSQGPIVQLENAKMLLHAGASLTIKNKYGKTPYEAAWRQGRKELAKYLWSQLSPKQQAQVRPPPSNW